MTDNTLSDKRSIPHWLRDHDADIIDLREKSETNKDADRELEKRVTELEFRMRVIMWIGGAVSSISGIVFTWLINKL